MRTRRSLYTLIGVLVCAPGLLRAQPDTSSVAAKPLWRSHEVVRATCLQIGHSNLDFESAFPDLAATNIVIEPLQFGKPVFFSISGGGHWGEEKLDSALMTVVMPEVSLGLICNVLAIPSVDRAISQLIPADLLFMLGVHATADYAPYMVQLDYHQTPPDSVEETTYHWDHVSWSYRILAGFVLDKSVGLLTEVGASKPIAGELRVARTFLRFGFIFHV